MTVHEEYRRIRAEQPDVPARWALNWARTAVEVDRLGREAEFTSGTYAGGQFTGGALALWSIDGCELRAYVDDEVYDWGDIEPDDDDRDDLEVIGIGVRVTGDDDDLDSLWSIGYLDGRMEHAALSAAVESGMLDLARREASERAYWLARDVETVA